MKRMKSFFIYFLLFVALFIVCTLLEKGLIFSMYSDIYGKAYNDNNLTINVIDAKATNVNGYIELNITNDSDEYIDSSYAKIEFIDKYNLKAITDYATITDLDARETKNYKITFEGNKIEEYDIRIVDEIPDRSNIIYLFGWEIDATNVFGLGIDLTNINGVDVTQYMSFSGVKKLASTGWIYALNVVKAVPVWGYVVASLIVIWYL